MMLTKMPKLVPLPSESKSWDDSYANLKYCIKYYMQTISCCILVHSQENLIIKFIQDAIKTNKDFLLS